jgi:hypothetical protein
MSQPPSGSLGRIARRLSEPNAPIAAINERGKLTYRVLTYLVARNIKPYYL